jgi:multidrug efflux pump subunit AcrA (membrane-fusion protein)
MRVVKDASAWILILPLLVLPTTLARGGAPPLNQEKGPAKAGGEAASSAAASKPATIKAERGPFKVEVSLPGVFESAKMAEVSIRPKAWSQPLVVERAIELGKPVKQGDILVEFDREKIDRAIQDAEVENLLGEQALKQAEEELPVLEKLLPIDLTAAERARAEADEDLKRFLEIDRPDAEKMAHFQVKSANEYLEYNKEELRQLEKMYRSKDLTEETEEIILRRTRFQVESSEVRLREAELRRDATLKVDLPRREIKAREAAVRHSLELQKARASLPLTLSQKRLSLAKLRHDHARAVEKLADLRKDRELLTVHTPADGLVYYGRSEHGHWPTAAATGAKLRKGGVIAADEVFITIVAPRPLVVRATVDEKDLHQVSGQSELKGRVIPAANPELSLAAHLTGLVPVPRESGKFDVNADVDAGPEASLIKPGMACTVKFTTHRSPDALLVPSSAVFEDEAEDGTISHVVYLPAKDGKPERRIVKTGKSAAGKTVILEGLHAGDEILTSKP